MSVITVVPTAPPIINLDMVLLSEKVKRYCSPTVPSAELRPALGIANVIVASASMAGARGIPDVESKLEETSKASMGEAEEFAQATNSFTSTPSRRKTAS